ncbi:MAG: polysaccharide deacetylase family protein [Alphaproteobacteria bacterium]|nr:polysaccharide deacetylase family protein [Alphaproteobacteria bacterium]
MQTWIDQQMLAPYLRFSSAAIAVIFFAAILVVAMPRSTYAQSDRMCWTPQQLSGKRGENRIRKWLKAAYKPLPDGRITPRSSNFKPTGRAIRRVRLPPGRKLVAFTFDLCEQAYEISGYQGTIVDYLRQQGVQATFFAGGKWMLTHSERAEQIMGDPLFEIGNHAWEHRNFQLLSAQRMRTEIGGTQLAYQRAYDRLRESKCLDRTAQRPAYMNAAPQPSLFRFPFGACTPQAIKAVESFGLHAIQWDVSSSDPWKGQSVKGIVRGVMKRVKPGSIVLFHANGRGWKTDNAIPILIRRLRKEGYKFVKVSELLRQGQPVYSTTCYDSRPGDVERYQGLSRSLERTSERFYRKHGKSRPELLTK